MNNAIIKKLLPHLFAFVIMMALSFLFFSPYFQGKVLTQGDNRRAEGMQTEMKKVKEETGVYPNWTNAMFAGMPTYQIMPTAKGNFTRYAFRAFLFNQKMTSPPFVALVAMVCFYLLLISLKVDWRIALIGAVAYGLSTFNIDLSEAGHSTKMMAMAYVPAVFAGALLAFRGRYWLGGSLFGFFLSLNIYSNHLQITFYMFLLLGILGLVKLITAMRRGVLPSFAKAVGVLAIGVILALSSNLSRIWPTQEYGAESIRGKSELSSKKLKGKGDGLDKDYIFAWSYGKLESFTLLVPNFMGGGASHHFRGTKTHQRVYKNMESQMLQSGQSRQEAKVGAEQQVAALFYWGDQPFVGVAIYFGAVLIFLFFLGAFLVKGDEKIWLIASAVFALMLAWGGNFILNHILVDYVPFFNKFRAVSMAMGLSHMMLVILAMLGLSKLLDQDVKLEAKKKALYYAGGITIGLCVLAFLVGSSLDMIGNNDARIGELAKVVQNDRASILQADVFRSILIILISGGLIFAYLQNKLKALYLVVLIGLISTIDVWLVNKRILFAEKYEPIKKQEAAAKPSPADLTILKDPDPYYRVADYARGNILKSVEASKFHKSIGGYHAAKLMVFQEVADRYLLDPTNNMHILGMLNTKYIMHGQGGNIQASKIQEALGNAWFVSDFEIVENADVEFNALANLKPAEKAIIQKKYAKPLDGFSIQADPSATIKLTSYHPDHMIYEYSAASEQLAVFSEVYYSPSKGWNTYLDGKLYDPFMKADYLLRAMRLPAGQNHKLEMKFEPKSIMLGDTISMIASLLLIVAFFASLYFYFKKGDLPEVNLLEDVSEIQTQKIVKTKSKITKSKKTKGKK